MTDLEQAIELAGLKLSTGDIDGAIAAYSSCITFAPHDAGVLNNFGVALLKARRFGEAAATLETALSIRPGYMRALVNLGKALRELGRPVDAAARLREALSIQPDYVPALINLGDASAAIGDLSGALQALEHAVRLAPAHVEAHMSLGIARLQAGQVAESLDALHAAVRLAPEHSDAHSNLAHALFCGGDWQAAWQHFAPRGTALGPIPYLPPRDISPRTRSASRAGAPSCPQRRACALPSPGPAIPAWKQAGTRDDPRP